MSIVMAPPLSGFHIDQIEVLENEYIVTAQAISEAALCPKCAQESRKIHSWYERIPRDLPSIGLAVRLCLQVRRFFCRNVACLQKVFCERLPALLPVYARRTARLTQTLSLLAFALGGEYGSRIVDKLGMPVSRDTLLRLIRQQAPSAETQPRIIGVDDWAFRKGHNYGTIICDLEAGEVIDLLPDREANTLAEWLKKHTTVEIITRDRSKAYAQGVKIGASEAIQIADRWHLLNNLVEAVEEVAAQHPQQLTCFVPVADDQAPTNKPENDEPLTFSSRSKDKVQQESESKRQARLAKYQQMRQFRENGVILRDIAKQVGVSKRTIQRWLAAGAFPERKRRTNKKPSVLDPYLDYLEKRWTEGCHNGAQLYRELRQQGFRGSYSIVYDYTWRQRQGLLIPKHGVEQPTRQKLETEIRRYSPRQTAFLFVIKEEKIDEVKREDLTFILKDCPTLKTTYELAREFARLLRQRDTELLDTWIEDAQTSGILELERFATGIERDKAEVVAAFTYPWSNGPVEGHVNRLKLIKRQMYGRANFDLLRKRVLFQL